MGSFFRFFGKLSFLRWLRSLRQTTPRRQPLRARPTLTCLEERIVPASPFTELATVGLTGVRFSSVAWGDYDNDAKLDILLTGLDGSGIAVAKVYHNLGGGAFTDISAGLTGV